MKKKEVLGVLMLLGTAVVVALYLTRSRPVLFTFQDSGDPLGPIWTLKHPFRDRAPERVAETFFLNLKRGLYDEALAKAELSDQHKVHIQAKESRFRLQSWSLIDRRNIAGKVELYYKTVRAPSASATLPVWIRLTSYQSAEDWHIVEVEAWYH